MTESVNADLLAMDEESLYAELGAQLIGDGPGFGPGDFDRFARYGTRWFADHLAEVRTRICGLPQVAAIRSSEGGAKLTDAATIADLLAASYGRPTAAVLSVIIVRRGLDKVCGD